MKYLFAEASGSFHKQVAFHSFSVNQDESEWREEDRNTDGWFQAPWGGTGVMVWTRTQSNILLHKDSMGYSIIIILYPRHVYRTLQQHSL